jgi:hypothetical protein
VTPEKVSTATLPYPDNTISIKVEFDQNTYARLCERYLTEKANKHGRKRRLLNRDASIFQELGKEVDRLLKNDDHRVFKILSHLKDYDDLCERYLTKRTRENGQKKCLLEALGTHQLRKTWINC